MTSNKREREDYSRVVLTPNVITASPIGKHWRILKEGTTELLLREMMKKVMVNNFLVENVSLEDGFTRNSEIAALASELFSFFFFFVLTYPIFTF